MFKCFEKIIKIHFFFKDVTQKIGDMVVIINGLHECEFELMTLLAKDSQASPTPIRVSENTNPDKCEQKVVRRNFCSYRNRQ